MGNALGGIRLPQMEAATGVNLGTNATMPTAGQTTRFDAATLKALYPDHATYVRRFEAAARDCERAGFLLERDANLMISEARNSPVPS